MEHAKKILLTDIQQPVQPARPIIPQLKSPFDTEISSILRSNTSDDQKAKLYAAALRKYRLYEEEPKRDPFTQLPPQMTPKNMIKTTRLLKYIKPYLTFNSDFELIHDGRTVPLSNVVELAEAAIQQGVNPIGWKEFADVLKRANVPHQLISNDSLWRYMTPKSKRTVKKRKWETY